MFTKTVQIFTIEFGSFRAKKWRKSYTVCIINSDNSFAYYDSITPGKMKELKNTQKIKYIYDDDSGEFLDI